ncbi:hypothetical protein V6N13_104857 [Hibiscus sabdariffa]
MGIRAPSTGCLKVNCDGSQITETGLASCGCVIRNEEELWVIGFTQSIGACSIFELCFRGSLEWLGARLHRLRILLARGASCMRSGWRCSTLMPMAL